MTASAEEIAQNLVDGLPVHPVTRRGIEKEIIAALRAYANERLEMVAHRCELNALGHMAEYARSLKEES